MTRLEQLISWLGDRQRSFADGVALFEALAKEQMKERYSAYFAGAPESPHAFDPHFTQLVNSLSKIAQEAKQAPSLYPLAQEEVVVMKTMTDEDRQSAIREKETGLKELAELVSELHERIDSLESDSEDHSDELDSIQSLINEKMSEMASLREEISALGAPGVKIVTEESLTPALRKYYNRIKEIAPLYASLHNDVANPDIPTEERQALAEQLCKLDDERRELWGKIDAWAEGKGTLELEAERPVFSENTVVRGIEIARRMKRLKENIANSKASAERAEKDGKKTVYANAVARVEKYEAELAELEKEISVQANAAG